MQPDQDRLRAAIEKLFDDDESYASDDARLYDRFVMADKLQPLIAREVRLGRLDEVTINLNKINQFPATAEVNSIAEWTQERLNELSKELPNE